MKLRLSTHDVPLFTEHGLDLRRERWSVVETDSLDGAGREALKTCRGRIVMVHPDDEAAFAKFVESLPSTKAAAKASIASAAGLKKEPA